jgi:hypothetical protein
MKPNLHPAGACRNRILPRPLRIAAAVILIGIGVQPACAQEAGGQSEWQLLVTPYLWITGVTVTAKTPRPDVPDVTSHVDFSQLLTHLTWVPFMGQAEVRNGPFGIFVDYLHAPVRAGITTRNVLFNGGTSIVTMDIATVDFLYRVVDQPEQHLDAGVGVRPWGITTALSLNAGLLPATKLTAGASWADPVIVARYHRELGSGFGLSVYGDVGGFGLGAHTDWQLSGTVDYVIGSLTDLHVWTDLHVGYRSLNVNYTTAQSRGFDVRMNGPLIAATFRF